MTVKDFMQSDEEEQNLSSKLTSLTSLLEDQMVLNGTFINRAEKNNVIFAHYLLFCISVIKFFS